MPKVVMPQGPEAQSLPEVPEGSVPGAAMPKPAAVNIQNPVPHASKPQAVEFIDALPQAAKNPMPHAPSTKQKKPQAPSSLPQAPSSKPQADLPEVNWLRVNAAFLDGRTAFNQWGKDIHGNTLRGILPIKEQFELLMSLGYEFVTATSVSGPGNYIMMFFKLKK